MCPFMWDPSVRGLLAEERTAAITESWSPSTTNWSAKTQPGERLARVRQIGVEMPIPGALSNHHPTGTRHAAGRIDFPS